MHMLKTLVFAGVPEVSQPAAGQLGAGKLRTVPTIYMVVKVLY